MIRLIQIFIASVLIVFAYHLAPKLDGRFFPVLNGLEIVQADKEFYDSLNVSILIGTLHKSRDCNLLGFDIYLGEFSDQYVNVRYEDIQVSYVQPVGDAVAGPYRVFAPLEILASNSFVIAKHECYDGWLWTTETIVRLDDPLSKFISNKKDT